MPYFNYGQLYGMTKVPALEYYGSGSVNQTTVSATQIKNDLLSINYIVLSLVSIYFLSLRKFY